MKFDVEWMTSENDFVEVVLMMMVVLSDLQHYDCHTTERVDICSEPIAK